ncbi:hypothetical protein [Gordonia alkanivorans]|uniref:Uncharacterized protein n=1 Tax=Gordonia alkanivorans NBRC 16433 TaxID=1027371 RepID=F9VV03_9ACTN|nr:hypothetical protein [Gordonia alkanivorans]GAA12442.1 hypothetical protein GOALK_050_02970 [Gordonia alkanivorans NBRC 16433]
MRSFYSVILALLLLPMVSCSGDAQTNDLPLTGPPPAQGADPSQFPFRWIPTRALDLKSPDGTFVRAIAETDVLFSYLGSSAMQALVPPGYVEAAQELWTLRVNNIPTLNIEPRTTYLFAVDFPDTVRRADEPRDQRHASPTPTDQLGRAAVCTFSTGPNPKPILRALFTYRRTGIAPPVDQKGALNQPTVNVFGDWTALEDYDTLDDRPCERTLASPDGQHQSPSPGWAGASH